MVILKSICFCVKINQGGSALDDNIKKTLSYLLIFVMICVDKMFSCVFVIVFVCILQQNSTLKVC